MKLTQVLPLFKHNLEGRFILLYGSNQSLMTFRARWIQLHLQRAQPSIQVVRNTLIAWQDDGETLSLFDDKSLSNKVVLLDKSPDKDLVEFLKSSRFRESKDTFILESPTQRKGSPLLTIAESLDTSVALACYDTPMIEIKHHIEEAIRWNKVPIEHDVLTFLCMHFQNNPSSIFLELEKILLHLTKSDQLTIPLCEELLYNAESTDHEALLDWITNKDLVELHQYCIDAFSDTPSAIMAARTLQRHFLTLLLIKHHVLKGHSFHQALSRLPQKPFFQTLKVYERIFSSWSSESLSHGLKSALEFESILKSGSGIQSTLLGQKLVALAISKHAGSIECIN